MVTVPTNKRMYIGAHRFVGGEVLPPHVAVALPVVVKKPRKPRAAKIAEPVFVDEADE